MIILILISSTNILFFVSLQLDILLCDNLYVRTPWKQCISRVMLYSPGKKLIEEENHILAYGKWKLKQIGHCRKEPLTTVNNHTVSLWWPNIFIKFCFLIGIYHYDDWQVLYISRKRLCNMNYSQIDRQ